jgi:hypothetical protein
MSEDPPAELTSLLSALEVLRRDISALQSGDSPECRRVFDNLDDIQRQRLARLEQFRDDQLRAARTSYEAAVEANEMEYENWTNSLLERIEDLIRLKFNILAETMPGPISCFQTRAVDSLFLLKISSSLTAHHFPQSQSRIQRRWNTKFVTEFFGCVAALFMSAVAWQSPLDTDHRSLE